MASDTEKVSEAIFVSAAEMKRFACCAHARAHARS
jgi:hypothetical protein